MALPPPVALSNDSIAVVLDVARFKNQEVKRCDMCLREWATVKMRYELLGSSSGREAWYWASLCQRCLESCPLAVLALLKDGG